MNKIIRRLDDALYALTDSLVRYALRWASSHPGPAPTVIPPFPDAQRGAQGQQQPSPTDAGGAS